MCGIAGIFHTRDPNRFVHAAQIENMLSVIGHRGPDESGIYLDTNAGMGNVRLSIIDLVSGSQPLPVQNNRYWIVYNGELFNYPELRAELIRLGHSFQTTSDTEVVVLAYAQWGEECLKRFNGQFALSIWDSREKALFLARDRTGIRPLFYTEKNGSFYYCSEVKGLFQQPEIDREISPSGLAQVFEFWTTLTPETPYKNIFELPPGHWMRISQKERKIESYWDLEFPDKESFSYVKTFDESVELFRELFRDAVKIRLRADVEVAAYLSGGIDSTVTTAFIHEIEPKVLNTFSIGFEENAFDESGYQKEASAYFNTQHTAYSCSNSEIGENFRNAVYFAEYPVLRTAPVPMYLLSKKVREQGIKVVITGEGADEILAGYNIFKEAKIRRFWANCPGSEARPQLLKKLYPYLPMMKEAKSSVLKMFFGFGLLQTDDPYYSHMLRWHNTSRIRTYFNEDFLSGADTDFRKHLSKIAGDRFSSYDDLAQAQSLEFKVFMSNYLLSSQGDRMAMGNSVEGRYPFLDHRVIEFAAHLPERFKLNALNEKFILKKMMKGRIPESILTRNKQAYRAPVSESFIGDSAPDYINEMLSEKSLKHFGYFEALKVSKLIDKIKSGRLVSEIDQMALAGILSTQLLHHSLIEGNEPPGLKKGLRKMRVLKQPVA